MTETGSSMSPLDVDDLRSRVNKSLDAFLSHQTPTMASIADELAPVVGSMTQLLRGGKRLRPAFAYWAWRGAGAADRDEIVAAVTALELLHACALVHDDVMDDSDTRRGLPSVHREFAALHRESGWRGSPENFGVGAAILLGDLCLTWADEMYFTSGLPDEDLRRAKPVYDCMRTELMAGQYLDLLEQAQGGGSVDRALRVARYKSAKYTVERPLHLGAALAGADDALLEAYSGYGLPLGEAFQLRDDVLGVFGDPVQTGKPAGDDLREGKRTVLIAVTLERASKAQADVVNRYLGDPALDRVGTTALREIIVDTGALVHIEELIATLTARAIESLASGHVPAPTSDVLQALALTATTRFG